jgi:hypothetical protein
VVDGPAVLVARLVDLVRDHALREERIEGLARAAGRCPVFTIARAKKREYRRCRIACSMPPMYWSTFIQ